MLLAGPGAASSGINSLRLTREVASAWKHRLQTRSTTTTTRTGAKVEAAVERLSYHDTLAGVRAFYLDLAEWALEDPGRWGPWVAACPISHDDLTRRKFVRRRKARMDARTRERLPVLPVLVRAADQWRTEAQALTRSRASPPGLPNKPFRMKSRCRASPARPRFQLGE